MISFGNFLYYVFFLPARMLPVSVYLFCTRSFFVFIYHVGKKPRKHALESLTMAYGDTISHLEKERLAWTSFLALGQGIAYFLYVVGRPHLLKDYFDVDSLERLNICLAQGKGVVIGTAHLGPFVSMLIALSHLGYKVNVVARPIRAFFWGQKFQDFQKNFSGFNLIFSSPLRSCVTASLAALHRNELLFMPVDQNYGAAGRVFVPFFGHLAATAPGPVVYARRTGAPLLMAFAVPQGKGFKIVFEGPLEQVGTDDEQADIVTNTRCFTEIVEKYIRCYPDQWSWMHRRWKTEPRANELVGTKSRKGSIC